MTRDLVGNTIGNYRIEEVLGSGGMGQVFRGHHVLLDRAAAIKVMHQHLAADPGFRARFLQEAKAAAALDHPNIVRIYEFDERDGEFYLVMELIEDGSLRRVLRERASGASTWSMRAALELTIQAADGLAYAHQRGMVHRDIKPDNLLLKRVNGSKPDPAYTVKISDFGLARLADSASITVSGTPMGTPAYLSPEQAQGRTVDGRSDIYSLGVVLYELATGYLPFDTKTLSDAVYKHVHVVPTAPRALNPDIPSDLETLILRCLEKHSDERYPTAGEMAAAQRAIRDGMDPITLIPRQQAPSPDEQSTQRATTAGDPPGDPPPVEEGSETPSIQVVGQDGASERIVHLPEAGLTIGRSNENDLTLSDESISRRHLRIERQGTGVSVVDLGSWNGTMLGDQPLLPQTPYPWNPREWLRVGSRWLRLIPAVEGVQREHQQEKEPASSSENKRNIHLTLDGETLQINPGEPVVVEGRLANLGYTVDHLTVSVHGVPEEWLRVPTNGIQLNPGDHSTFSIHITVPRSPDHHAGMYPVEIQALSATEGREPAVATATWEVQPFAESSLRLDPERARGRTGADFTVTLANGGNAPAGFSLRGTDAERRLKYRFHREEVEAEPGESVDVGLAVRVPRRWRFGAQIYAFTVEATPSRGDSRSVTGQLQQSSSLPILLISLIAIVLIGAAVVLTQLPDGGVAAPRIERFTVEPAVLNQGDSVAISWQVAGAEQLKITLPSGTVVPNLPAEGQSQDTPSEGGDYTLRATGSEGGEAARVRSIEVQAATQETPTVPPDDDILDLTVSGLARDDSEFEIRLENTTSDMTIEVSIFSLAVSDDFGNRYELDPFAMDRGLQASIPAGSRGNIEYALTEPVSPEASSVTLQLNEILARPNDSQFGRRLPPMRVDVPLQ